MAQAPRKTMHLSPIGEALHVHLHKADEYKDSRKFKTKLVLEGDALDAYKAEIDKMVDDAFVRLTADMPPAKVKKLSKAYPYEDVLDKDGNETGKIAFRYTMNAEIKTDDGTVNRVPLLVDSKRIKLPPTAPPIFSGATIRTAYTTREYLNDSTQKIGITLDLQKVQLIKYGERRDDRPDNTFGDVEGGWTPEVGLEDEDGNAPAVGGGEF